MIPVRHSETRAPSKGHLLFISRQRIIGKTNGSSAYLLDLAAATRNAGFTPHLVQPSPDLMGRWPFMRLRPEMSVFESQSIRGVLRIGRWILAKNPRIVIDAIRAIMSRAGRRLGLKGIWLADKPRPYAITMPWTPADRSFVKNHASRIADVIIADYAFQAEAFDIFPGKPCAIVMHDLFSSRDGHAGDRDSVPRVDRDSEIALLARADAVIAIQSSEADFLVEHVPSTKPILAHMAAQPIEHAQQGLGSRLLFVGSNTAPNIVGLEWMFEKVWPLLRARAPDLTLDVAGSVAAGFPHGGPAGVVFHGMVNDLAPFYALAGVIVSPLTFGSGLKIKLIEALAQGKAVVATSVTLQGVEQQCAGAVAQADGPDAFAAAILALADDESRLTLAEAALAVAREHFSPQACHGDFIAWLTESTSKGGHSPAAVQPK